MKLLLVKFFIGIICLLVGKIPAKRLMPFKWLGHYLIGNGRDIWFKEGDMVEALKGLSPSTMELLRSGRIICCEGLADHILHTVGVFTLSYRGDTDSIELEDRYDWHTDSCYQWKGLDVGVITQALTGGKNKKIERVLRVVIDAACKTLLPEEVYHDGFISDKLWYDLNGKEFYTRGVIPASKIVPGWH